MNGNCHFINGIAVTTLVSLNIDNFIKITNISIDNRQAFLTCLVLGGVLGSIFPDIDNPTSHFGQLARPFSTIIAALGCLVGKRDYNHRWILHDLTLNVLGFYLCTLFFPYLTGFFIGTLSHLALDTLNPSGIPVFFGMGNLTLAKVPSNSRLGTLLSYACAVALFILTFFVIK